MVLSNYFLIEDLCKKQRKKIDNDPNTPILTADLMRGYFAVIEETLLFHSWLKQDNFLNLTLRLTVEMLIHVLCTASKIFLELFKGKTISGGHNFKISKFILLTTSKDIDVQ